MADSGLMEESVFLSLFFFSFSLFCLTRREGARAFFPLLV